MKRDSGFRVQDSAGYFFTCPTTLKRRFPQIKMDDADENNNDKTKQQQLLDSRLHGNDSAC